MAPDIPPSSAKERVHEGAGVPRSRAVRLAGHARPRDPRRGGRDRPGRGGQYLRHRPAHPQGRRARRAARHGPRPRGGGRGRRDRQRGARGAARRPGAGVVHLRVRQLPLLPRGRVRAVHRRRGLDTRPHRRRDAGRVRTGALRGHVAAPAAGVGGLPGGGAAGRHLPDRLRGRRAGRPGQAGRHRGGCRLRPRRARRDRHRPALLAVPHRRRRRGPDQAGGRQAAGRGRDRHRGRGRTACRGPDRRARRGRGDRGGRTAGGLRAVRPHGPPRRAPGERRRPRQPGRAAPGGPVEPEPHPAHRPGGHLLHPDPAAHADRRHPPGVLAGHPHLRAGADGGGLRRLRPRRRHRRAQGGAARRAAARHPQRAHRRTGLTSLPGHAAPAVLHVPPSAATAKARVPGSDSSHARARPPMA
ncbi:Threonine dehydrogenase and related Zn-dependent dehydrogenases [Actinacidiphila bryophytorum]|uniref:Threonine dehydrogenase and related Zn-dependent dehydrogenases n=1 Tax=Actinacidiphila bryophytorum TaxID=1436133 RepID=A0A9W4H3T1_9ACTN|nr:Threonine dehydrogenase and related Zn-dependent dehydrogenases [Actinacidiphila bryophytorum]